MWISKRVEAVRVSSTCCNAWLHVEGLFPAVHLSLFPLIIQCKALKPLWDSICRSQTKLLNLLDIQTGIEKDTVFPKVAFDSAAEGADPGGAL